ncbi:hypothetical protein FA15DRAFT_664997 [Coprinopsis marcescibilis]|uniref:N-acetyltransferase domain-containing protein n=1 Tax=Coprinopsis marcescibilis TaxID=230819 RepID=A0A5C3L823_COPMA|nr:hypothetical protein FA15DRAFT_664997 [Coprinopsis marcescibilis]
MGHKNSHFWSTLLELDGELEVKFLKDGEVRKAAQTWNDAFTNDPLLRYFDDNEPKDPRSEKVAQVFMSGILLGWIRRKITITVKGGASLVVASPAPSSVGPGGPRDRMIDWIISGVFVVLSRVGSKQRRKRALNARNRIAKVIQEEIGARQKDMIYVNLVCTAPASQGHGFASALLDTITRMADMLSVACWLESSNVANEGFYNSHGFYTVGEAAIGDDDPTWKGQPVIVQVMVREPKGY